MTTNAGALRLPVQHMLFSSYGAAQQQAKYMAKAFKATVKVERIADKWRVVVPAKLAEARDSVVIASVVVALAHGVELLNNGETALVLQAMRRSSHALASMTDEEIGKYLTGMTEDQLRGFANNVKGIYHELVYAKTIPGAELFEATNHPGADISVPLPNGSVESIQIKSGVSVSSISEHQVQYPDIRVVGTPEQAAQLPYVESSGISNVELESAVSETVDGLTESTLEAAADAFIDVVGVAGTGLVVRSAVRAAKSKECREIATAIGNVAADVLAGATAQATGQRPPVRRSKKGGISKALRKGTKATEKYVRDDLRKTGFDSEIRRTVVVGAVTTVAYKLAYKMLFL